METYRLGLYIKKTLHKTAIISIIKTFLRLAFV